MADVDVMTKQDLDALWAKMKDWFVKAPISAVTANTVAVFDGTTGKVIKSSGVVLGTAASRDVGAVTSGNVGLVTGDAVNTAINAALTAAMKIEGETTTAISDGSTTNPVVIGGQSVSAYKGMVVFYGKKEFVWQGAAWKELGDEGSFALKTTTVTGTGYLTGGGALSANQTLDIASSVKTKIDNGATAYGWGNHANAGYALAANLGTASTHAHGDYVTAITYDSTNRKLQQSKGGGAATDIVQFGTNAFNSTAYLPLAGGTMANTDLVTNLNAEYLGGTKKADLFSALTNDNDQLSATIGGTNKKVTVGYASRSTDTRTELLTGQEFVYRQTAGGGLTYKPSSAVLKRVLGNTVVWNQILENGDFSDGVTGWKFYASTGTASGGQVVMTVGSNTVAAQMYRSMNATVGHKYYQSVFVKASTSGKVSNRLGQDYGPFDVNSTSFTRSSRIVTCSSSGTNNLEATIQNVTLPQGTTITIKNFMRIDLTLMFGEGNEPSTVEEFEALYPNAYYDYNADQLINNSAEGLETVGFNLWDEEWELGRIDLNSGVNVPLTTQIRAKNYIPIIGGQYYCASSPNSATFGVYVIYYDVEKNPIVPASADNYKNEAHQAPINARFARFYCSQGYGTIYNHDICINLSDPAKNGQYEPYKKNVLPLFPLKCKAPNGDIVIITDAKSAGSVRDERVGKKFIRRAGEVVYKGTENWGRNSYSGAYCFIIEITDTPISTHNAISSKYQIVSSINNIADKQLYFGQYSADHSGIYLRDDTYSNVTDFKNALAQMYASGNPLVLNYELATPIEYEIIDEAPYEYPIDTLGTEKIVSDELVAPFVADIQYGAEQRNVAYDINNLHSNALALKGRASVLEGYFTNGIANNAARLSNTSAIGSTTKPVYFTANGVPSACSDYAGGTAVTLNGSSKAANTASFYAPTGAGTSGQILKSTAGAPEWINQSAIVAGKATQLETSRNLWGNSFNGTANIAGAMTFDSLAIATNYTDTWSDGTNTHPWHGYDHRYANTGIYSTTISDYFGLSLKTRAGLLCLTEQGRVGIGSASPAEKLHVDGNIYANGWIITNGTAGWYSKTYGGGWFCDDYTYVKTYGNRSIYTAADVLAGGNIVGTKGVASQGIANLSVAAISGSNFVTQVKIGSTAYNPSDGIVSLPAYPTVPTALSGFTNDVGYITNVTGNQVTNALGYVPAKKQASTETVTGAIYDAASKVEVYDIWTPSGTTATFKLPYDCVYDVVNYVLIVNILSSDITVSFIPQVGTAHIIAPNNSLVVPAGKAIEVSYLTQLIGSVETVVLSWSSAFNQYTIQ